VPSEAVFVTINTRFPTRVRVGPKLEAPTCDVFKAGGPHFTDAGSVVMARTIAAYFAREPEPRAP
jgi:hypothetical protein